MQDEDSALGEDAWPQFGVVCGEDIDSVLRQDEAAIRAWSIEVLSTALERVVRFGTEADELLRIAIEVLWQFSGGEDGGSEALNISRWLEEEHPRGRAWSEFAVMVQKFVARMEAMLATRPVAAEKSAPNVDDGAPF
jgi:hypothetical protein